MRAWLLLFACAAGCGRTGLPLEEGGRASTGATTGSSSSGASSSSSSSSSTSSSGGDIVAVSAGLAHTCAIDTAGGLRCWGSNEYGELGNDSTTDNHVPVAVSGLSSGVAAVSAGAFHTCAATKSGGAVCWGLNHLGELGNDSTTESHVPVPVSGLSSSVTAVSAGAHHTCAIATAGGVQCWGWNLNGELGTGSTIESHVPIAVSGLSSGVSAISAGWEHTCARTTVGGVQCWGLDDTGQLGDGSIIDSLVPVAVSGLSSGVAAVSAGQAHTCALTTAGGVLCWGLNVYGELGDGSTIQSTVPIAVSGLSSGVSAVSVSGAHNCALTMAGGVLCWGDNGYGQLGDDSTIESHVPVAVSGLSSGVAAISAGGEHTCALTTAGTVLCWGQNTHGELGDGTTIERHTPVPVLGP